jgi:type II secretory pathway component PulF
MKYNFKIVDRHGKKITVTITANSQDAAKAKLIKEHQPLVIIGYPW